MSKQAEIPFSVVQWARKVAKWGGYGAISMRQHIREKYGLNVPKSTVEGWLEYRNRLDA